MGTRGGNPRQRYGLHLAKNVGQQRTTGETRLAGLVKDNEASRWFASIVGYDYMKMHPLDDDALGEWCVTMREILRVYDKAFVGGIRRWSYRIV